MKKVLLAFAVGTSLIFAAGCSSDPVADEMVDYVNKTMKPLSKQEDEVIKLYESVSGDNYTDDLTMHTTLTEKVIPKYNKFLEEIEDVSLETDELQKLHEKYINAVQIQQSGMVTVVAALEEQSFDKMDEANKKLNEARKMMRDYQNEMKALAKEHDVKLEAKD